MHSAILLIQATSQNVALFCAALFAGACTYVSLVEQPTILEGGREMTDSYMLLAQPRPTIFQTFFAAFGAAAGIAAGVTGQGPLWTAGGIVLGFAAMFQLAVVNPVTARLLALAADASLAAAMPLLRRLARLNAVKSLAGLVSLFMFIVAL